MGPKNIREKHDLFSALPELDITIAELQKHVADSPAPKSSVLRYSSLAVAMLAIGVGYFIFGNRVTVKKETTSIVSAHEEHPLMLPFIEKKGNAMGKPVYGVLFSDRGTAYFKNVNFQDDTL